MKSKWLTLASLFIGSLVIVGFGAITQKPFSVFDEATQLDNAWRYSRLQIPRKGHRISPEILSEWSCRGFYDKSVPFPACAGAEEIVKASFPFSLSNYNTMHPPLYYAINGVVARIIVAVTPVNSFVTAARLANFLWLAFTISIVWWIASLLELRRWHGVALAGVAVSVPTALSGWFYVNNDVGSYASAWAITAALVYAHRVGVARGYRPLVTVSVLGCMTKAFTIGAVLVSSVVLLFGLRETGIRSSAGRTLMLRVLGLNAAAVASVAGWIGFNHATRTDIPYVLPFVRSPLAEIPWKAISEEIIQFRFPNRFMDHAYLPSWMQYENGFFDQAVQLWLTTSSWFLAALALALALGIRGIDDARFSRSIGFGTLLGPPMVATMICTWTLLSGDLANAPTFVPVIDRYHLSVVPFYVLGLGIAFRSQSCARSLTFGTFAAGSALVIGAYFAGTF